MLHVLEQKQHLTKAVYNLTPQPAPPSLNQESLGRGIFPNIKVLCHLEEGDAKVEALLDPMIIGCSVCLVFEAVSLVGGVIVTIVTGVGVCSVGGTSDPVEHLKSLTSFCECGVQREAFVKKPVVGLIGPQQVEYPGRST